MLLRHRPMFVLLSDGFALRRSHVSALQKPDATTLLSDMLRPTLGPDLETLDHENKV